MVFNYAQQKTEREEVVSESRRYRRRGGMEGGERSKEGLHNNAAALFGWRGRIDSLGRRGIGRFLSSTACVRAIFNSKRNTVCTLIHMLIAFVEVTKHLSSSIFLLLAVLALMPATDTHTKLRGSHISNVIIAGTISLNSRFHSSSHLEGLQCPACWVIRLGLVLTLAVTTFAHTKLGGGNIEAKVHARTSTCGCNLGLVMVKLGKGLSGLVFRLAFVRHLGPSTFACAKSGRIDINTIIVAREKRASRFFGVPFGHGHDLLFDFLVLAAVIVIRILVGRTPGLVVLLLLDDLIFLVLSHDSQKLKQAPKKATLTQALHEHNNALFGITLL
mmetsp:Transcript_14004/g.22687  ORF Transcript_14004/g.22687 Transcript_14004/m.22687 type:complete len:331 (-) Transcript_14004:251-1243(-)